MGLQWARSLFGAQTVNGDGDGLNLAVAAPGALEATAAIVAAPRTAQQAEPPRRDTLEGHLAAKVLGAHLANRYQTSYPLTLQLALLSDEEARALMSLAADALMADGEPPAGRLDRTRDQLRRLGATPTHLALLDAALAAPEPLGRLADEARRLDKAAHAYALALVTGAARTPTGLAYLSYLALRLALSRETVGSLSRRYRG